MTWLYKLDSCIRPERGAVGGKALGLAQLHRFKHKIPNILMLDVPAMERIFSVASIAAKMDSRPLAVQAAEIQRAIMGIELPADLLDEIEAKSAGWLRYCVRSSAVQEDSHMSAWAGILCSYTNLTRPELREAIHRCWASLYSAASLEYAVRSGHRPRDLRIALMIQEFVAGDTAGICFSVEPVSRNAHTITIEAAAGPASAITDGSLIPDRYLVSKQSLTILEAQCVGADRCVMARSQIQQVARAIRSIEEQFAHAVDVEWTIKDGVLTLLQARQVTSLDALAKMSPGEPSVRFWWLDFDAMWQFVAGAQSFDTHPEVPANRMGQVLYVREKHSSRCLISVDDALRLTEMGSTLLDDATYRPFRAQVIDCLAEAKALSRELAALVPTRLPVAVLTAHLLNVQNVYQRCVSWYRMFDPYMTGAIVTKLACHLSPEAIGELLQPVDDMRSLELADWAKLAAKDFSEDTALEHVSAYPWLVCNEYTRLSIVTSLREKHRQSKHLIAHTVVPASVDMSQFPADVRNAAVILRELSDLRIQLKMAFTSFDFHFVELYDAVSTISGVPVRNLHEDYSIDDMVRLLNEGKPTRSTALRIIEYRDSAFSLFEIDAAREFLARLNVSLDRATPVDGRLEGTVAFHGTVTGCVRVVNCNDVVKTNKVRRLMEQGDILVSEMIQLNIMDLVQRAGGLITDEGGMLSHAAILARELRIPCIVGTQRATQMLKDGDRVEIKSELACVELLPEKQAVH